MSTASANPLRPLPTPADLDRGYWEAAKRESLVVQACAACGLVRNFPRLLCPECASFDFEWVPAKGAGTLYSWSALRRSFHPGFVDLPLIIAIIELDDHPTVHLVTNLVDLPDGVVDDPDECERVLELGSPVEVTFERLATVTLPQFRLAKRPPAGA